MDFDAFLTTPRWEILKIIAEKPSSPIEIAEKLNTTVAYVSQQLKLLDAANMLFKVKTGAALKGKPRTLFSISKEFVYLTTLIKGKPWKRLVYLTDHHKLILKIWSVDDVSYHHILEKLYFKLEEELNEISGIFIENSLHPRLIIITDSKKLRSNIESSIKVSDKQIECIFITKSQLKKFSLELLIPLYDPHSFIEVMKGGKFEKDE